MFKIQIPATSANLGAGFDALGLALTWEDSDPDDHFVINYKEAEVSMYVRIKAENAESLKTNISELFGKLMYIERANRPDNEIAFITPTMKESEIDEKLAKLSETAEIASKIRMY